KRAAFALIAEAAVHDKGAADQTFIELLPLIEREAGDERHYVRKAVSWALRQIGKRNSALNEHAVESALRIQASGIRSARWVASDALRELRSDAVRRRLSRPGILNLAKPVTAEPIATGSGSET
ncbi:MAG TPA: DNA alkylation repair protein, partial [Thermomicrobiaceae bacterium]|nr:DNA alkylation repair protein [Thermomicrobiaceae bacterium]